MSTFAPIDGCSCDDCVTARDLQAATAVQQRAVTASGNTTFGWMDEGTNLTATQTAILGDRLQNSQQQAYERMAQAAIDAGPQRTIRPEMFVTGTLCSNSTWTTYAFDMPTVAAERELSTREKNLAIFAARGITPIPDDECTDKGDYVIWNNWDPTCTLMLYTARDIENRVETLEQVMGYYGDQGVVNHMGKKMRAHPEKPVRVAGWYATAGASYTYYRFTADMQQRVIYVEDGYASSYSMSQTCGPYLSVQLTKLDQAPKLNSPTRQIVARRLLIHVERRVGRDVYMQHNAAINSLFDRSPPTQYITARNNQLTGTQYVEMNEKLKAIGEMVRLNASTDWSDLVDAIERLGGGLAGVLQDSIVEAWNNMDDNSDTLVAASCGHVCHEDDACRIHNGDQVCESCFDEDYVRCENTDEYHHREDVYEHDNGDYYTYRQDSDEYGDDDDESEDSVAGRIRGYSDNVLETYKADPKIKTTTYGEFLMGIELEVVPERGSRADSAIHTTDNLCQQYAILKDDGSLADGGFEIVTAPRGLAEHIERFTKWKPHPELRAWDAGCCGMHVHLSSAAFSQVTLGKFVEFINAQDNDEMICSIAGRTPTTDRQASQYCQREGIEVVANPKMALRNKDSTRYRMVNTGNMTMRELERLGLDHSHESGKPYNTVELRIFRATLKKSRLLAQIEFAHAAVMFCRWTSMRELRKQHFVKWLRGCAGSYPHLAKWFGVRANTLDVVAAPAVREEAEV